MRIALTQILFYEVGLLLQILVQTMIGKVGVGQLLMSLNTHKLKLEILSTLNVGQTWEPGIQMLKMGILQL